MKIDNLVDNTFGNWKTENLIVLGLVAIGIYWINVAGSEGTNVVGNIVSGLLGFMGKTAITPSPKP
jgi:hypothetical protein